jgi:hypothetical protein
MSLFRISLCLGDSLGVGDLSAKGKECHKLASKGQGK